MSESPVRISATGLKYSDGVTNTHKRDYFTEWCLKLLYYTNYIYSLNFLKPDRVNIILNHIKLYVLF